VIPLHWFLLSALLGLGGEARACGENRGNEGGIAFVVVTVFVIVIGFCSCYHPYIIIRTGLMLLLCCCCYASQSYSSFLQGLFGISFFVSVIIIGVVSALVVIVVAVASDSSTYRSINKRWGMIIRGGHR
jgi:hypothetical protein